MGSGMASPISQPETFERPLQRFDAAHTCRAVMVTAALVAARLPGLRALTQMLALEGG